MDQEHIDAGWFLTYPNGTVFNTLAQARSSTSPTGHWGPWMNQYFIDWRNPEAAAYFVSAIVNSTLVPGVDGTFTDDEQGVPAEHPELKTLLKLTDKQLSDIQFATQSAEQYLVTSLAYHG